MANRDFRLILRRDIVLWLFTTIQFVSVTISPWTLPINGVGQG